MNFYNVDVGQTLEFHVIRNGKVANLATATAVVLLVDGITAPFACTIGSDPTLGIATYTVRANDFPTGSYTAVIRTTYNDSTIVHSKPFAINSRALYQ